MMNGVRGTTHIGREGGCSGQQSAKGPECTQTGQNEKKRAKTGPKGLTWPATHQKSQKGVTRPGRVSIGGGVGGSGVLGREGR